jgi:hypothetical protein
VQHDFRTIVSDIPLMSTALGQAFGMSAEAAMKVGTVLGIVAVAVDDLINDFEDLLNRIELSAEGMNLFGQERIKAARERAVQARSAIEAGHSNVARSIGGNTPQAADFGTAAARTFKEKSEFDNSAQRILDERCDRESSRLAGAMVGSAVGRDLLNETMTDEMLHGQLRPAMARAGMNSEEIDAAADGVARKLREKIDNEVQARALERGVSVEEARAQLSIDAGERAKREGEGGMPRSRVISDKQYLDNLLTAGLKKQDPMPGQQLAEAQKTNAKLDKIAANLKKGGKGDVARFTTKRGPG